MNGVLEELVAASRGRHVEVALAATGAPPSLAGALRGRERVSLLAEFKRRSPSDPSLAPQVDLDAQLLSYARAGAAGVSVLTEPTRFGGSVADLRRAVAHPAGLPILRKDFLVRPEQVVEAAAAGASAVLLIVRCLDGALLSELVAAARGAGVEVLLECHDEGELDRAVAVDGAMLGVNNRDLDTLRVDRAVTERLAPRCPADRVVVAESGYDDPAQLDALRGHVDAVLIGAALMRGGSARAFAGGAR